MFSASPFRTLTRSQSLSAGAVLGLALAVAGCLPSGMQRPGYPGGVGPQTSQPAGEVIGSGGVRVALLLPQSGGGNGPGAAAVFRNAARLGLQEFPGSDLQLLVKDTGGTAAGASLAAQQALSEGAELILGPVFSASVTGAAQAARPAGVPIIGFSSNASVAGRGVYLLSFLPQDDVRRMVSFAAASGKRAVAALFPDSEYGAVVEAAFRQEAASNNVRVISIQKYAAGDTADMQAKAAEVGKFANRIDSVYFPGDPQAAIVIARQLAASGVNPDRVKYMGGGQWDNSSVFGEPTMRGAWFPAPTREGFASFARKYQAAYGSQPPRNATLAYDAVTLAVGLVRSAGPQRFSTGVLTNADGFLGIDGIFRFRSNGLNERGLAVYEVGNGSSRIVSPARRSFSGS